MKYYDNSKYLAKETANNYDKYLPNYYFFNDTTRKYEEELEIILAMINDKKFESVLELGVGTGRVTEKLISKSQRYTGIDISDSMIQKINEKLGGHEDTNFYTSDIGAFINKNYELNDINFLCSFWAFNYSVLSHFEYKDFETNTLFQSEDLELAEEGAIKQIKKLFSMLAPKAEFLFLYFDAYSVEQSYVTRILEKTLPFPYNDRGYTFKVFKRALSKINNLNYSIDHLNGFVKLDNDHHLLNYFKTLHLKGEISTPEDEDTLFNSFNVYKNVIGEYHIPAGVNIVRGRVNDFN